MKPFSVAAIQLTSGDDIAANIAALATMVAEAAQRGATLIATPENTFYMRREGTVRLPDVAMAEHPGILWALGAAKQHQVWLLIGSIRALEAGNAQAFNRSVLISPQGEIAATYDKIHLFDVTLPDGQHYLESTQVAAGARAVTAPIDGAQLGFSVCYDLRFPYLYQALAHAGATLLAVPAAFTKPTGAAHWQVLLQARAIENGCYVIAPAQCGVHPGGRETYGHSLIIDPWGDIIAEANGDVPEIIFAQVDPSRVEKVRGQIPALKHAATLKA